MPDLLDFFINKGVTPDYIQDEPNFELSSDHTPDIETLSSHILSKPASPTLTGNITDWNSFRKYLENNINLEIGIKEPNELDEAVQNFTTLIQQAAWHSTAVPTEKLREMDNIPLYVKELVTEKRRARNRWQRTRSNEERLNFNRLRRKLHNTLKNISNSFFEHYITSLSTDDHSIWKATKEFKRPQTPIPPIRKPDSSWARSDSEKAEAFAKHLEDKDIELLLETPCQMPLPIKSFCPKELRRQIKNLNPRKAPGYDLITSFILKQLPKKD
jgi:hypothetical protein